ncbi:UNVERIFIED_CONTAM: AP-4 complex subunit epsilon, partial [Sesamum radiatum]
MGSQGGFGQSKEFLDLVKSIGEARSKAEEDRIVLREIETLKVRLNDPNTAKFKLKEYVIRLLYVEVLGHDASFGYIHAVKMTHDENLQLKRTGYLAVTLFLNEDHDLIILIVNTIQKDLKSDNYLVVCAALNAVCRLINEETIPAVLPQVVALLGHQKEAVRKKAVMALHRFYQRSPGSVSHLISHFRKRLSDNDPGVMGAALCPLFDLITIDVNSYKDLVVSFVNILKQVAERRLPKSYDYHQMPAPFIQSDSHNLKYLGIDALSRLIKISPEIAEQHQLAVIDCLEDPDDTLKRKTFELLYKMTKSSNVQVIVDRMIDYMIRINDNHYKTEIASRCVELAEQFAPSNQWFIQTMNKVFEHAGDLVNTKVAHNLMRLIAEGFGEDDDTADSQLRSSAVESYLQIMGEPKLPSAFLQVICWVLGEYGTADGKYSSSYITGKLCDVAEAHSTDDTIKAYAVTALTKIYSFEIAAGRKVDILPECLSLVEEMLASHSTDLQQRAYELQAVLGLDAHAVEKILPMDSTCEDIEVDKNLSFLHGYVQQALENGAQPYIPRVNALEYQTLATSRVNKIMNPQHIHLELSSVADILQTGPPASDAGSSELKLRLDGVQRKWGRPAFSSVTPSTSSTNTVNVQNEATQRDPVGSSNSKARDASYDSKKQQVEVSPEKQQLAASLFGGASKSEKRQSSIQKMPKSQKQAAETSHVPKAAASRTPTVKTSQPPPDLLDLSEPSVTSSAPSIDPFKQLEGLLDLTQDTTSQTADGVGGTEGPEFSLFADMSLNVQSDGAANSISNVSNRNGLGGTTIENLVKSNKGPNLKEALERDAHVRQMGVTPS